MRPPSPAAPDPAAPDPAAWSALHEGASVVALPEVGSLRVSGEDRAPFLHGQLAHDVRGLPVGGARRSLRLDVKGHALAELAVHVRERDVHLAVDDGAAAEVAARLRSHVVFDQVEIEVLGAASSTLTVQGPRAREVLAALGWPWPEPERFATRPLGDASLLIAPRRRSAPGGVDVHLPTRQRDEVAAALASAGAVPGDRPALEASRVAAGLARAVPDAGPGVLPQEAGLDAALSTRKGCYLGQEMMARIEARGRLKRSLAILALGDRDGDGPADDARAVLAQGRRVGRLGTVALHPEAGLLALAVLRDDLPEDAPLRAAGRVARVLPAPAGDASRAR